MTAPEKEEKQPVELEPLLVPSHPDEIRRDEEALAEILKVLEKEDEERTPKKFPAD